jgi:hypothetical protein
VSSIIIYNQCSDFELVSPAYFGHNAIWHIPPDQKVDTNTVTRASLGRGIAKNEFASALSYKLQRKKQSESNNQHNADNTFTEYTSTSLQLLVIWGYNIRYKNKPSVRALLIKHNNTITWDEDTLEKLYSMYFALLKDDYNTEETWLLDDATVLVTTSKCKDMNRATKITISEGTKEDDSMGPLCVPLSICL